MDIENEKDGSLNNPVEWGKSPTRQTTVNFDAHLHNEAKQNKIALKDALEFGIKFLLADKDGWYYPQSNLLEKLHKVIKHRNALIQEVDALRKQLSRDEDEVEEIVDAEAEAEKVFGGLKNK